MSLDTAALGLALRTRKSLRASASRRPATLLVLGQSTEQGPVPLTDRTAWPNAFQSLRNPAAQPKTIAPILAGGWWSKVYDDMWDWGYDLDILNAASAGASLVVDMVGVIAGRANSYGYYQKRTNGIAYPDLGDFGSLFTANSKFFGVTAGRQRAAFGAAPHGTVALPANFSGNLQGVSVSGTEASAATATDLSGVAVGATATDGDLTVQCLNSSFYVDDGAFRAGIDGTLPNRVWLGALGEVNIGRGYDPLGIIASAHRLAQSAAPAELKIVYFSNGQSDLGVTSTVYQRSVMMLVNFFLRRGWTAVIGNTIYSPGSAGSTSANYDAQVLGVDNAVAQLLAAYPGKVYRGANLYAALGSTGAMGGQRCTGGVSGTTLTVSAVQGGTGVGIAVGQNVWNGTALVGVITALGTGSGGAGTYGLDRSATVAGGTALVCAGSGLQYDGIHQNGSMVAAGGAAIAGSLKAFLPKRSTL